MMGIYVKFANFPKEYTCSPTRRFMIRKLISHLTAKGIQCYYYHDKSITYICREADHDDLHGNKYLTIDRKVSSWDAMPCNVTDTKFCLHTKNPLMPVEHYMGDWK